MLQIYSLSYSLYGTELFFAVIGYISVALFMDTALGYIRNTWCNGHKWLVWPFSAIRPFATNKVGYPCKSYNNVAQQC